MALTATPIYAQTPKFWGVSIVTATGFWAPSQTVVTNLVSLAAGGTNGAKIEAITVSTGDTVANRLALVLNDATNNYILAEFSIPPGAGNLTTIPAVSLLNNAQLPGLSSDPNGNKYLYIPPASTLYVGVVGAAVSAQNILSGVVIASTSGGFTNTASTSLISSGNLLTISGTLGGTGTITGYVNPTTYVISLTNGSTSFTLTTVSGAAIVTTTGTPTGLTYTIPVPILSAVAIGSLF